MNKISKSPDRNTFQKEMYIKRMTEENKEASDHMIDFFQSCRDEREQNPEWANDNLEHDLRKTTWILEKARTSDAYSQNLYAALCNNDFVKRDLWPLLKEEYWHCSWRHAGGIIADMREEGDYIDWYCSGIQNDDYLTNGYVAESVVTEEIEKDLYKLGWLIVSKGD